MGPSLSSDQQKRHRTSTRDAAVGRAKARDAAAHAGTDDAATRFASNGKTYEPSGSGSAGASARAGSAFFEQPGIHGLAAEPNVIERERAEAEFCEKDSACVVQTSDDCGIGGGNARAKGFRKCLHIAAVWSILIGPRHPEDSAFC